VPQGRRYAPPELCAAEPEERSTRLQDSVECPLSSSIDRSLSLMLPAKRVLIRDSVRTGCTSYPVGGDWERQSKRRSNCQQAETQPKTRLACRIRAPFLQFLSGICETGEVDCEACGTKPLLNVSIKMKSRRSLPRGSPRARGGPLRAAECDPCAESDRLSRDLRSRGPGTCPSTGHDD
jgi:hypothetical protein